ncbi:MAG: hypothetical protein KF915_16545 [Polyangiaceae bacterium]|nr:hypothetical protein [Polyangiaceae bacterium]
MAAKPSPGLRRAALSGALAALGSLTLAPTSAAGSAMSGPPSVPAVDQPLSGGEPREAAEADGAACVSYRAESRYQNYGYDHWVHLTSRCAEARRCHVTTQSNPSGVHLTLAAGASASELLFRGSPASEPGARVSCGTKG